jgi:ParB family transcriptional regulator, chromosome partitioning protein
MVKRRSLGRGLEALLGSDTRRGAQDGDSSEAELRDIPVDLLERGRYQPRVDMRTETLAELAESIRAQGLVQPIVVRPLAKSGGETRYEIVAGERRWRAAQIAGLEAVPALVRDISDRSAIAVALIENIQRENLNPLEEARALTQLVEEFDMTHAQAADAVGRSRAAVTNLLRLLELPAQVQTLVEQRAIDMGHARALLALQTAALRVTFARRIAEQGWSVREAERAIRRTTAKSGQATSREPAREDPDIRRLQLGLGEALGAAVKIEHGAKGGRVVIKYNDLDELEGILAHIK